jgi:hypothetical protein
MRSLKRKFLTAVAMSALAVLIGAAVVRPQSQSETAKYAVVGKSVRGRLIHSASIGKGKKRVLVLAGIHGDERATAVLAKALIASLSRDPIPDGPTVTIVSEVNPDGLVDFTRVNASRVDINRNFPAASWRSEFTDELRFPGKEPASEPETRAMIDLLKRNPPDVLITLHAALGCMNWDGPGEEIAAFMAGINSYELCPYLGYETPGSLGSYAGVDLRIPTVTIELRDIPDGEVVAENLPALRAALIRFGITEANQKP